MQCKINGENPWFEVPSLNILQPTRMRHVSMHARPSFVKGFPDTAICCEQLDRSHSKPRISAPFLLPSLRKDVVKPMPGVCSSISGFSPYITLCGWQGSKHQLTNSQWVWLHRQIAEMCVIKDRTLATCPVKGLLAWPDRLLELFTDTKTSRQVSARVSKSQLAEVGERQREPVPLTSPHCHIASDAVIFVLFCLFMSCFVLLYLFCCCGLIICEGQLRLVSIGWVDWLCLATSVFTKAVA